MGDDWNENMGGVGMPRGEDRLYRAPEGPFPKYLQGEGAQEVSRSVLEALLEERGESRDNEFALRWFKQYMHRLLEDVERLTQDRDEWKQQFLASSCACGSQCCAGECLDDARKEVAFLRRGIEAYRASFGCRDAEGWGPAQGCEACEWEAEARERGAREGG